MDNRIDDEFPQNRFGKLGNFLPLKSPNLRSRSKMRFQERIGIFDLFKKGPLQNLLFQNRCGTLHVKESDRRVGKGALGILPEQEDAGKGQVGPMILKFETSQILQKLPALERFLQASSLAKDLNLTPIETFVDRPVDVELRVEQYPVFLPLLESKSLGVRDSSFR